MPTTITFARVQAYLNAIADRNLAEGNGDVAKSPHGRFWNVTYEQFIDGIVPGGQKVECMGQPTPIINKSNPALTPIYLILTDGAGYCNISGGQMPESGPYITDPGYQVTLPDGTVVAGTQIKQDLLDWLLNGFPA